MGHYVNLVEQTLNERSDEERAKLRHDKDRRIGHSDGKKYGISLEYIDAIIDTIIEKDPVAFIHIDKIVDSFLLDPKATLKKYNIKSKNTEYEKVWASAKKKGIDIKEMVRKLQYHFSSFSNDFKKWVKDLTKEKQSGEIEAKKKHAEVVSRKAKTGNPYRKAY